MSNHYHNVWIPQEMSEGLARAARIRGLTEEGIFGAALRRALDLAEAEVASSDFEPARLSVVEIDPFIVATYSERIAGVAVMGIPTRNQMLIDWAPWFLTILRRSNRDPATVMPC